MNFLDTTNKKNLYKIRQPYTYSAMHGNDVFLNLGYNYRGNILVNFTSPELWANPQQISSIKRLESILIFLIETTKNIKKHFSIAHSSETININ